MNRTCEFVDCQAIKEALENNLPDFVKVLEVWEGCLRNDDTITVYVKVLQKTQHRPRHFTQSTLSYIKEIVGELLDVEIKGLKTLEFGFALPLTSHYYLHK